MNGALRFLDAFFPSAQWRYVQGQLEPELFEKLCAFRREETAPDFPLLEECFPCMVRRLKNFPRPPGMALWSDGNIKAFLLAQAKAAR